MYTSLSQMRTVHARNISVSSRWLWAAAVLLFLVFTLLITPNQKQCAHLIGGLDDIHVPVPVKNDKPLPRSKLVWRSDPEPLWDQTLDFNELNFSNITGNPTGTYLVPNYIHFLNFGGTPINYVQMVCILAAFKNQNPDKMFFHFDDNRTFTGKYWEVIENTPGLSAIMEFHTAELPTEVFGQPLSEEWRVWHGTDILRIKTVMKYGGVFLDNDCYLIKSIDDYRRFEISMNWDEGQFLGSQVIIAHKDARFLRRWLDCYRVYDKTQWYYNAGERPTVEVLYKEPELLHRVKILFGADNDFIYKLLQENWDGWRNLYILHLLIRHQEVLKALSDRATFPVEFNEFNIGHYPITFREMAYDVYDVANIKWPKLRS